MDVMFPVSSCEKKFHGVLQGSILVPLLLSIYTLPLALIMESVTDLTKHIVMTHNSNRVTTLLLKCT